ncbi:MAG: SDR family oxidoreductase [Chloroflexota bacterium]
MRLLICGASGLLGVNLALEVCKEHEVVGIVHQNAIQTSEFQVVQADLGSEGVAERLIDQFQPDWLVNCVALADLDACEADPPLAKKLNHELPAKLAAYVARGGARLLHVSTDAVFDGQRGNYREEDTPSPLSVYARTKLDGEQAVLDIHPQALIVRINFYGWSISGQRSLAEFFYNNLNAGKPVMGFTDIRFCPLLVNDLARLLLKMMEHGLNGLYHVVAPEHLSKYEFGVELARQFGFDEGLIRPTSLSQAGLVAARSPNLTLSVEKLQRDLPIPLPSIKTGLLHFRELLLQGYPQKLRNLRRA